MNIAKGMAASISLQSLGKKTEGNAKTEAFLGKVIGKSGKEIQVLINDKVYKIEPGNAKDIKIGDKIQVFFGKDLPQQISEEALQKISGKLIDVFSLSLPYHTTKELEHLINQMPQSERLQFAKISNAMVQMVESILKDDYSLQTTQSSNKNTFNLFDPNLPFNRRLIELSLKAKEMGKAWDQIPDNIKREIIKEFVLFDLKTGEKGSEKTDPQNNLSEILFAKNEKAQGHPIQSEANQTKAEAKTETTLNQLGLRTQKHENNDKQSVPLQENGKNAGIQSHDHPKLNHFTKETSWAGEEKIIPENTKTNLLLVDDSKANKETTPVIKTLGELVNKRQLPELYSQVLKKDFNALIEKQVKSSFLEITTKRAHNDMKTLKQFLSAFLSKGFKNQPQTTMTNLEKAPVEKENILKTSVHTPTLKTIKKDEQTNTVQEKTSIKQNMSKLSNDLLNMTKIKITNNQNTQVLTLNINPTKASQLDPQKNIEEPSKNTIPLEQKGNHVKSSVSKEEPILTNGDKGNLSGLKNAVNHEMIKHIQSVLEKALSKPLSIEKNLESLERLFKDPQNTKNDLGDFVKEISHQSTLKDPENILSLIKKIILSSETGTSITRQGMIPLDFNSDSYQPFTFKNILKQPLMDLETKNLVAQLSDLGINKTEALKSTYDIVNIAFRSVQEENIDTHLYPRALKRYLKISLPQMIINNDISQDKENELLSKIETFSKKAFHLIKEFAQKLNSNQSTPHQQPEKPLLPETTQQDSFAQKKEGFDSLSASTVKNRTNTQAQPVDFDSSAKKLQTIISSERAPLMEKPEAKEAIINTLTKAKNAQDVMNPSERNIRLDVKAAEPTQRSEITAAKYLKFLNITTEKHDVSNIYSSLITIDNQPFSIDFHHQKMDNGSYEKKEMYRVFIETNTQLFGTVFVDTVVANKKIDIYIYAAKEYAKEFTNHSSTIIKRLKETEYTLSGLFVREKIDQNEILKLKVKQSTHPKKEGGFYSFA